MNPEPPAAAVATLAGLFPVHIPRSKNSFAAGAIFIFLLLLLLVRRLRRWPRPVSVASPFFFDVTLGHDELIVKLQPVPDPLFWSASVGSRSRTGKKGRQPS